MRMLVVSNLYPPEARGGAEIICADFAGGLRRLGWDVQVIASRTERPGLNAPDGLHGLLRFHQPPVYSPGQSWSRQLHKLIDYRRTYFDGANAGAVRQAVGTLRPDLVLVSSLYGVGGISILDALRRLQVPVVALLQDYWMLSANAPEVHDSTAGTRFAKRALAGFRDAGRIGGGLRGFVAISEYLRHRHVSGGLPEERFEVVSPGIPSGRIGIGLLERQAEPRILYAGRLVRAKGVHVLLEALGLANRRASPRVHLDVAGGNGPADYLDELRSLAREVGVEEDVTWHGWLERGEIDRLHRVSSALVVPSLWDEPLGVVAIEALALGLPVIASRRGGLPEIVEHGRNGFLFESGDVEGLAERIAGIVRLTDGQRAEMSREALAVTRQKFCLEANAGRLAARLEEWAA